MNTTKLDTKSQLCVVKGNKRKRRKQACHLRTFAHNKPEDCAADEEVKSMVCS